MAVSWKTEGMLAAEIHHSAKKSVFKYNTRGKSDAYLRTVKAIATIVGKKHGPEMFDLVKHGNEMELEKP